MEVKNKKILIIVAHPDDAELSMGMSINSIVKKGARVRIMCLSEGEAGGDPEIRKEEAKRAGKILGAKYKFSNIKDGSFKKYKEEINSVVFDQISTFKPNIIYTHFSSDMHPDHEVTSEIVKLGAFSSRTDLLFFQSPYSKDFNPNIFHFYSEKSMQIKLKALRSFKSQKQILNEDLIRSMSAYAVSTRLHHRELKEIYSSGSVYSEQFVLHKQVEVFE